MKQQQLQEEILTCIWSTDLKQYIAEHNYAFSSTELLSIAYHYAPTYAERLRLLQLLADYARIFQNLQSNVSAFKTTV